MERYVGQIFLFSLYSSENLKLKKCDKIARQLHPLVNSSDGLSSHLSPEKSLREWDTGNTIYDGGTA